MIPSYELSPSRSEKDNYRKRFHRVSRRQHGSKSMMSDTRRKSCITEFEEDLGKAAKNPIQELFAKFCSSSTIHGTYFWIASGSQFARIAWGFIGTQKLGLTFLKTLQYSQVQFLSFLFAFSRENSGKLITEQT